MRRQRQAKIVATLGPASSDAVTIRALFDARGEGFAKPGDIVVIAAGIDAAAN